MNIIFVMIDSLRRDHLGCMGNPWIQTPNLDAFSQDAFIFNDINLNAMPTIPFRRSLMTGRAVFPYKDALDNPKGVPLLGWQPLHPEDITFQEILRDAGYVTGMISDAYHCFAPGMNFHRGFLSWEFIRGQEGDPYRLGPTRKSVDPYLYPPLEGTKMQFALEQHLRNVNDRTREEDYFAPQVFRAAEQWLSRNALYYEKFFLYVDCFDPHEPWDPPREYIDLYSPNFKGREIIFPQGGHGEGITDKELEHIRALYAAEVSMVDRWFGHFMEKVYQMGLDKETAVLVMGDHGHPLGEHGIVRKIDNALYPEMIDVPMMLMMPKEFRSKKNINGIIHEYDIAPTILKLLGLDIPEAMTGRDFWPLITQEKTSIRDYASGGYHSHAYVRDLDHHYFRNLENDREQYLFDLKDDPCMKRNIAKENVQVALRMEKMLIEALDGWVYPKGRPGHTYQFPYTPLRLRKDLTKI